MKMVPINSHEANVKVVTFCVIRSQFMYAARFSTGGARSDPFLFTAELGSAAGVASHSAQLLSMNTAGKVTDDILLRAKGSGLELHYFVHILRSDVEIKAS